MAGKNGLTPDRSGRSIEQIANIAIAAMMEKARGWNVSAERTGTVVGQESDQPDIVAKIDGNAIIVETEYHPASTLRSEVDKRTKQEIRGLGVPVAVLGVILPLELRRYDIDEMADRIAKRNDLKYYVRHLEGSTFPKSGYLEGSIFDVMTAVRLSSVPQTRIIECVKMMENSIEKVSYRIDSADDAVKDTICRHIRQKPSKQTWGMAALVLLNAGIFYEELAGRLSKVKSTESLRWEGVLTQDQVVKAWKDVLAIDYDPIFNGAVEMLRALPAGIAADVLGVMSETTSRIMALKVSKSGDVYGMLYQDMLEDRKRIAAFYTRPEAAALLAGLVMSDDDTLWKSPERIKRLRIADFACGTGMLLTAAYGHMIARSESDISALHKHIMENCLYGYDILPTGTHLTASNLAGLFPDIVFDSLNVYTMPIGKAGDGYSLGSLDLKREYERFIKAGEKHGGRGTRLTQAATVQDGSCDYILMNPPYASATNHGKSRTDPVPPFALFGISTEDQIKMAGLNNSIYQGTCADGNAGLASHFIAICDKKLKPGGVMGLILPNTMFSGPSWSKVRLLLKERYDDVTLVLVGPGSGTYSSKTNMNETMLVARKMNMRRSSQSPPLRIKLALVDRLPASRLAAQATAKQIRSIRPVCLEDDAGHTSIIVGSIIVGKALSCPVEGSKWWVARVSDTYLLSLAWSMAHNRTAIPMTTLDRVAKIGLGDRDITGHRGEKRGPFNKIPFAGKPKYPCLWSNDSKRQISMLVEPDCALEKKSNATMANVEGAWDTSTHTHINRQARYTTQRLIAAYTEDETIGGAGWPNVMLDESYAKAFMVWCNSVFGILMYLSSAGSQQGGRGRMSPTAFKSVFPILDFTQLSVEHLTVLDQLFDENKTKEMLPINRLDEDPVRQRLDHGIREAFNIDIDLRRLYEIFRSEELFDRSQGN